MSKEFDELQARADKRYERQKERLRNGYAYARAAGFSVQLAMELQGAPKAKVDRLAKELPAS